MIVTNAIKVFEQYGGQFDVHIFKNAEHYRAWHVCHTITIARQPRGRQRFIIDHRADYIDDISRPFAAAVEDRRLGEQGENIAPREPQTRIEY